MEIKDALLWVEKNCRDETVNSRLRSRMVAKMLADENKRLKESLKSIYALRSLGKGASIYSLTVEDIVRKALDCS